MSDEQWLRHTLEASVPDPPRVDRLGAVRERRRRTSRRRRALVATGAALAVALAAVAPVVLHDRGRGPAPADVRRADARYDGPGCPSTGATRRDAPDDVPAHPVSVRLCALDDPATFQAPPDALVTGADQLAALLTDQPAAPGGRTCAGTPGHGFELVFASTEGTAVTVRGELGGCQELMVGQTTRTGASTVWDTFLTLLRRQRAGSEPRSGVPSPTCGTTTGSVPDSVIATWREMRRAVFCPDDGGNGVALADADLVTILADLARGRSEHRGDAAYDCANHTGWRIVGISAWGDVVRIAGDCARYDGEEGPTGMSAEVRRVVRRLLTDATHQ